jgi:hypothetical protein
MIKYFFHKKIINNFKFMIDFYFFINFNYFYLNLIRVITESSKNSYIILNQMGLESEKSDLWSNFEIYE